MDLVQGTQLGIVVAFGLVLGSFLNVCIYRLPLGQSIVSPGSRCMGCGRPVRWFENVPVLSWLVLRGRCAGCKGRISFRYPAIEMLSALVLVVLWYVYEGRPAFWVAGAFALGMIVLFFTDLDHQLLPDAITLVGFGCGIAVAWWNPFLAGEGIERVWGALQGAALGSGVLWGIGALYSRLRGVEAMGMGDVKMMAMVGAFTGPAGVVFTIFCASLVGAVLGLLMIPIKGRTLQDALPFGCFLAPAAMAAMIFGRDAVRAYFSLLQP